MRPKNRRLLLAAALLSAAAGVALFELNRLRDHGSPVVSAPAVKAPGPSDGAQGDPSGTNQSRREDAPLARAGKGKQLWDLPKNKITNAGAASPTQKSVGRSVELDLSTISSFTGLREGDEITIPVFDGAILRGKINRRQVEASGLVIVGGQLNGAQAGTFSFGLGGAGFHGSILLPDKASAYVVEQTSVGGAAQLVEKKLSEVVCFPLPKYESEVAPLNDQGSGGTDGMSVSLVVPVLSSRPAATAVMYMDFDGESVTDPSWNGGRAIDAKPANLTAEQIVEIWHRVSEDYVGFNIDVTTDVRRYNNAPVGRRMRCIVTPTDTAARGAGGVAYLNSFAEAGKNFSDSIPCWVFNPGIIGVSEAVSHEFGHTFGLRHDGRSSPQEEYYYGQGEGDLSWAPIMGVGYYKNVVQWSKGEYAAANNQEDDVAVIASPINGFGFSADEAGDTIGAAATLSKGVLGQVSQDGVVQSWADIDVYKFTAPSGLVHIDANPSAHSPDLDIVFELKNGSGTVLASSNPDLGLNASISYALPTGGTYYLSIKGTGHGDAVTNGYSNYGSAGAYSLRGGIPIGDGIPFLENGVSVTLPRYIAANYQIAAANSPTLFSVTGLPAGMSLNSTTGLISGIPTAAAGNYTITVTMTNALGSRNGTFVLTLTPEPAPTVAADAVSLARRGKFYSLGIAATALPISYSATGLPSGLTVNTTTGLISGTPTVAGIYPVAISATNASGTGTANFSLVVVSEVQQVAAGLSHSLFVRNDGTLWATGANYSGQLGDGTWVPKNVPIQIATGVTSVAAGYGFSLFLKIDGTLWGMGDNTRGQLGTGTGVSSNVPVQVAAGVTSLAAGSDHSLFLKTDGTLWATGANDNGQLGNGTTGQQLSPIQIASSVAAIAAGTQHSLFVKTDGTLWSTGLNSNGQLGDGTKVDKMSPVKVADNVFSVTGGSSGSLFIKTDATLWGMGFNSGLQISTVDNADKTTPVKVADGVITSIVGYLTNYYLKADETLWLRGYDGNNYQAAPLQIASGVRAISTNSDNLLFLTADGRFWGKGQNSNGSLGDGSVTVRTLPVLVGENIASVEAGLNDSFFITRDGGLLACGYNSSGQLGDGTSVSRGTLVKVASDVLKVSSGTNHSLFVKADGTLWGTGASQYGQLKSITNSVQTSPVALDDGVASIAAGEDYSLFLKTDGRLFAMGTNGYGQLGDGTKTAKANGVLVATGVSEVKAGVGHSLFIKTNGTLWAMGWNNVGQLGDGSTADRATPVLVASTVTKVAASRQHSLFLKSDGTIWAMGDNQYGQLGDGTIINRSVPVSVGSGVVAMAADTLASYFIKNDGTLWAMGNGYGPTPSRIARGIKNIAANGGHLLLVKQDGTAWAMGENYSGQLGDGMVNYYDSPIEIKMGRPAIATQTMPFEVNLNGTVTLSATAIGQGPLQFQWRKDGIAIAGATVSSYTVSGAQASDGGRYDVLVTNSVGSVISTAGDLFVLGAKPQFTSAAAFSAPRLMPFLFWVKAANDVSSFSAQNLPAGLVFDTASGLISGIPTAAAGTYAVSLTATNAQGGTSAALTLTITGEPAPVISSGRTAVGRRGVPFLYAIGATPQPQTFGATGLPVGLSVDSATGRISGTPTDVPGVYTATVSASNQNGTGSLTVRIALLPEWQDRVSAGVYGCFVVDDEGGLWAAGYNYFGQQGDGSTVNRGTANRVATNVISVTAGITSTLFIKTDGTVWGMGWNLRGELGLGNTNEQNHPVLVATDAIAAGMGFNHSLILKADGGLWAMGANESGELGNGTTNDQLVPVLVSTNVRSISSNGSHSLFIKSDGSLWGMGSNSFGQLGDGTTENRLTPVPIAVDVGAVSASSTGSLFLKIDGTLWGMGFNGAMQIWSRAATDETFEVLPIKIDDGVTGMAAGPNQNLYLKADGSLWGRGLNWWGQLGDETKQFETNARQLGTNVVACSTGQYHSVYRKSDGSVWTIGSNSSGELANGYNTEQPIPLRVALNTKQVSAGGDHTLFVTVNGDLWGMGYNGLGSLGDGTNIDRAEPVQIAGNVSTAVTSFWHDLIIKDDGSLWAVGNNGNGQLGIGSVTASGGVRTLQQVDDQVKKAATGGWHSVYLKNDGSAWAMGYNGDGQLGDGTNVQRPMPVIVMTGVMDVAAGYRHSLFLKSDGSLWATGLNENGQLGDGTKSNRQVPIQVATGVAQIAAGGWHSLLLKTDGSLWAMGYNSTGQLGDGTSTDRTTPIHIDDGVRSISAGVYHSQYVKLDGSAWAVGQDSMGQLGDGAMTKRTDAISRTGDLTGSGSVHLSISSAVLGATKSGGFSQSPGEILLRSPEVRATSGFIGQVPVVSAQAQSAGDTGTQGLQVFRTVELLGNGSTQQQLRPVQIATGVSTVSAGQYHSAYVRTNGSLWMMGLANNGRLGNGAGLVQWQPGQVRLGLPAILSQTIPYSAHLGERIDIAVAAAGLAPLTYQWRKDGQPIAGATDARYGWSSTSAADGGVYDVVVANNFGSKSCTAVNLSVVDAPPAIVNGLAVSVSRLSDGFTFQLSANNDATGFTATGLLPGLSLDGKRGILSGVVSAPVGVYHVALTATNANGSTTADLVITVTPQAVPVITSNRTIIGRNGQFIHYQITGQNAPQTFSAANLPSGLAIDPATGEISGRVLAPAGRWASTASATNSAGTGGADLLFILLAESSGIAAGRDHSLVVDEEGVLWAMGQNAYGQLGGGNRTNWGSPTKVATDVVAVAASQYHSLFLKSDGTLWGMGYNQNGQLGTTPANTSDAPIQIASRVQACSAGQFHSLFLDWDGVAWAMGKNDHGQLGDGTQVDQYRPVQVASGVTSISAGLAYSLYVKQNGSLWGVGDNSDGQLGDGTTTEHLNPFQIATGVRSASAGYSHTLYIGNDGTLWAVGDNSAGALGDGTYTSRLIPVPVASGVAQAFAGGLGSLYLESNGDLWGMGLNDYGQLLTGSGGAVSAKLASGVLGAAAGVRHNLFLDAQHHCFAVGYNTSGQLGDSTLDHRSLPGKIEDDVNRVTVGTYHTMFIKDDQSLWGMGIGYSGQRGAWSNSLDILAVPDVPTVSEVSANYFYTLFIDSNRTLWGMGYNGFGEIGGASIGEVDVPWRVASEVVSVSAGTNRSFYITTDGSLWGSGQNSWGNLGDGSKVDRPVPVKVATNVAKVAAGAYHTLYLKNDGSLWGMGLNAQYPIISTTQSDIVTPVQIATDVTTMAAGNQCTFFVKRDGTLWGMGANDAGQLGDGTKVSRPNPVQIATGVSAVRTADYGHTVFLKSDGTLWAMGINSSGELGDGTQTDRLSPVLMATGVASIAAGEERTFFLKQDHTLWSTGSNSYGRLGVHFTLSRSEPFKIPLGAPVVSSISVPVATNLGGTALMSVTAVSKGDMTYQWRKNGAPIAGATGPGYFIGTVTAVAGGLYDVMLTGSEGSVVSASGSMTVLNAAPVISSVLTAQGIKGSAFEYRVAANNDASLFGATGLPAGLAINSATGKISGTPTGPVGHHLVSLSAANSSGAGQAVLDLEILSLPSIATQPTSQTVIYGASVTIVAAADGSPAPTFQWKKNGADIPGATNAALNFAHVQMSDAASYTFIATNSLGSATSNPATLTVNKAPATVSLGNLAATYNGAAHSASATTVPASLTVEFTYDGSPTAPTDAGSYTVVGTINDSIYQGSTSGTLNIGRATPVITWGTPSAINYGTALNGVQLNATANVAGSFAYSPPSGTVPAVGTIALSAVFTPTDSTNYNNASANQTLHVWLMPIFTTQPTNHSVNPGQSTTFSVAASGSPAPTYRWQRLPSGNGVWSNLTNGGAYSGTTTPSLLISNATLAMNGDQFRCLASNSAGVVASNGGVLTVTTITLAPGDAVISITIE